MQVGQFLEIGRYKRFIEKLGYFASEFRVSVYAYCCMPNHFHLYLSTKEANLSRFMQSLLTSFCVSSNKKRRSCGHIFQGRFKAHLVDDDLYRSRLSRYIHLNPIRIQALREVDLKERHNYLRKFRWSSYPEYIGIAKKPKWLDCAPVQQSFSFDEVIKQVAKYFGVDEKSVLTRKSGHREARRVAMYCASTYCRHHLSVSEMATRFSVGASALAHARDSVATNSLPHLTQTLRNLKSIITKT